MSQNINLYDPDLRLRRDLLGIEAAAAMVIAAMVVVAIGAFGARWSLSRIEPLAAASAGALEAEQSAARAIATRATTMKPDMALQSDIAVMQRNLLQRRAALQMLESNAPDLDGGFSTRLEALARQSVDGLWLTGMVLRQNDVLLKGRTLTPSLIPLYVQRLDHEPSLQGHAFKALDVSRPVNGTPKSAAAPPATGTVEPDSAAAVQRAEFVEFTLVGTGSVEPTPIERGERP